MNVSDSECSSGCESGWTLYLEQSFPSPNASHKRSGFLGKSTGFCDNIGKKEKGLTMEEEEEEEDLSMVSDASSGPPHFHEEEEEEEEDDETLLHFNIAKDNKPCFCSYNNNVTTSKSTSGSSKRQKMKEQIFSCGDQDDTASSPLFNLSNMEDFTIANNQGSVESVLDYSQGFSATHFQRRRRPAYQDPFGFLQSSLPGNQLEQMSDLKGIRRWK